MFGVAGTDNVGSEDNELECTTDYESRSIKITDAVEY